MRQPHAGTARHHQLTSTMLLQPPSRKRKNVHQKGCTPCSSCEKSTTCMQGGGGWAPGGGGVRHLHTRPDSHTLPLWAFLPARQHTDREGGSSATTAPHHHHPLSPAPRNHHPHPAHHHPASRHPSTAPPSIPVPTHQHRHRPASQSQHISTGTAQHSSPNTSAQAPPSIPVPTHQHRHHPAPEGARMHPLAWSAPCTSPKLTASSTIVEMNVAINHHQIFVNHC